MNWQDAAQFWRMGGYALYVWGSLGAVLGALLLEWLALGWRQRQALAHQAAVRALHREDGP